VPSLAALVLSHVSVVTNDLPKLSLWVLPVLAIGLLPLRSRHSVPFAADFPVMTAVALLFSPTETALIAFVGSVHPSEFTGERPPLKMAFNHSQISASWWAASALAHALTAAPQGLVDLVPLALLALFINCFLNLLFVGIPLSLKTSHAIRLQLASLQVGAWSDFGLAFVAAGSMGAMLAAVYQDAGLWIIPISLPSLLLTRLALLRSEMLLELDRAYRDREAALTTMAEQIDRERTDERRLIAADLHDDVLQPLFSVSLLAQTLRNDLATGRLLELEDDIPRLTAATESASETIRALVGDLRKSGLGRGGLAPALRRLVRVLQHQTKIVLSASVDAVELAPAIQLATYQIAKEALGNVLRHSRARNAWVELEASDSVATLLIRDDGIGFDPSHSEEGHYGILIMKERAASVGGSLYVDSAPGEGSCLRAVFMMMRQAAEA